MEAAILKSTSSIGLEEEPSAENRRRLSGRPKPLFIQKKE